MHQAFKALVIAFTLITLPRPATAQSSNPAETAIRDALIKWTSDFNAGDREKICGLFAPELRYDYRGHPERRFEEVCGLLQRSLSDRTKTYFGRSSCRAACLDAEGDSDRLGERDDFGGTWHGHLPQAARWQLENHSLHRLRELAQAGRFASRPSDSWSGDRPSCERIALRVRRAGHGRSSRSSGHPRGRAVRSHHPRRGRQARAYGYMRCSHAATLLRAHGIGPFERLISSSDGGGRSVAQAHANTITLSATMAETCR
jgi:hypothetical protein